jgi:hypothetical protein
MRNVSGKRSREQSERCNEAARPRIPMDGFIPPAEARKRALEEGGAEFVRKIVERTPAKLRRKLHIHVTRRGGKQAESSKPTRPPVPTGGIIFPAEARKLALEEGAAKLAGKLLRRMPAKTRRKVHIHTVKKNRRSRK